MAAVRRSHDEMTLSHRFAVDYMAIAEREVSKHAEGIAPVSYCGGIIIGLGKHRMLTKRQVRELFLSQE